MAAEPNQGAPGGAVPPAAGAAPGPPPSQSPAGVASESDAFAERPEVYVGAAFAGGLALALVVRKLTS